MAEEKDTLKEPEKPKEPKEPEASAPEEEEFEPPVRQEMKPEPPPSGETPEGKKFWYELRKLNERLDKIEGGYGETEFDEDKKREPRVLSNEVDEKLSAFVGEMDKRERQREFRDFLKGNPEFGKYGKKLERFINHPAYQNVPIDFIARALAFDEAQKIGAEKGKEADLEAGKTKIGGSPFKPSEKAFPDYEGMTKEEFEKEMERAKRPKE